MLPVDLAEALRRVAGRTRGFAGQPAWYDCAGSTNDLADRAAAAGAPHGFAVAADAQSDGRGRMGRAWFSPPGSGLYVSVVLRPGPLGLRVGGGSGPALIASSVTMTAGVALAEAVRASTGLAPAIKWPNDVVVGPRKLCGILAEASVSGGAVQHIVLGFGVNVQPAAYPPDLADRATSVEAELGRPVDRALVFAEALASLAERLRELASVGFGAILDRWRTLSPSSVGAPVELVADGRSRTARTAGVAEDGALLASVEGRVERVIAGEVRWLGHL
jgi:BirA family biotin operon repressor/biotin-[acetyl-CoA-carboxylase] ligase